MHPTFPNLPDLPSEYLLSKFSPRLTHSQERFPVILSCQIDELLLDLLVRMICKKSRDVSTTMCDVMRMTILSANMLEDLKAYLIQMRCAHTEFRLCIVQLACICLWTNGKKTTNKEGTMLVYMYSVHVMYILSHIENWEYLHPCSTADAC